MPGVESEPTIPFLEKCSHIMGAVAGTVAKTSDFAKTI